MNNALDSRTWSRFDRPGARIALVALVAFFILFARRYAQMLDPQVWDEDGFIVPQIATSGVASLLEPINGYLIFLPRLLSLIAMLAPLAEYPRIVTMLTWGVTIAILLAIAFVPSQLRGRPLLVLVALLVPTDAEVYGLSLYIFWWSILLIYACVFWHDSSRSTPWRVAAIIVGGLSSPAIILATPLFIYEALRTYRTRNQSTAAVAAIACSIAQLVLLLQTHSGGLGAGISVIVPAIEKFAGGYLVWNFLSAGESRNNIALAFGTLMLAFVAAVLWRERHLREPLAKLIYLWLGSAALSLARADITILDPARAGPRYFFLPFVVEGWILVQIVAAGRDIRFRAISAVMLVCVAFNALPALSRSHDDLGWKPAVRACASSADTADVALPIEYDGHFAGHWTLSLTGYQCKRLSRFGLLGLLFSNRNP